MESDGFFCERCKTRFRSKNIIDKHTFKPSRGVVCNLCEKVIVSMKTHTRKPSTNVGCNLCGKVIESTKTHRSTCLKLQCSKCNKRFERIHFLTPHENACGSKRWRHCNSVSAQNYIINCSKLICTKCGKRFPYQSDL